MTDDTFVWVERDDGTVELVEVVIVQDDDGRGAVEFLNLSVANGDTIKMTRTITV